MQYQLKDFNIRRPFLNVDHVLAVINEIISNARVEKLLHIKFDEPMVRLGTNSGDLANELSGVDNNMFFILIMLSAKFCSSWFW